MPRDALRRAGQNSEFPSAAFNALLDSASAGPLGVPPLSLAGRGQLISFAVTFRANDFRR